MIYLLTSNSIPITSIKAYNDNFTLSLLHSELSKVHKKNATFYQYDIFIQDGMDTEEFDITDNMINVDIHEYPDITSSLDKIAEIVYSAEHRQDARDEDVREEITLAVCCQYSWNQQVVKYLNSALDELGSSVVAISVFKELHVASMERLSNTLQTVLNTTFIYPDDPVSFGYALHYALGGML